MTRRRSSADDDQRVKWIYRHPKLYEIMDFLDCLGLSRKARRKSLQDLDGNVLEVGVGSAISTRYLPDADLFGIDTSIFMLRAARRRAARVSLASSRDLPFKDGEFDKVLFIFSLRVMSDQRGAIEEALRVGAKVLILDFIPLPRPLEWLGHAVYGQSLLEELPISLANVEVKILLKTFIMIEMEASRPKAMFQAKL